MFPGIHILIALIMFSGSITLSYSQIKSLGNTELSDSSPYFGDGDESLIEYLQGNIRITLSGNFIRDQYQRASVRILVSETGAVVSFTTPECTDLAMREPLEEVFRSMPAWKPAKHVGKDVRSYVYIDFTYLLSSNRMNILNLNMRYQQLERSRAKTRKLFVLIGVVALIILLESMLI